MRNSIYDLEDARLEIGSVTTTPSFGGKPGVGFTTNSTPYAFLLRDFTSEVFGNNTQVIEWSHTHNMNDYRSTGTYRIKGERTGNPMDDNLPIMNQGSGHTIEGILYVLDSSLTNGSGNSDDCTITQFLMLSNRVGGQKGDMYMRSAYGANKDSLTWKPWEKYQTNVEVGCVSDYDLLNPSNPTEYLENGRGMLYLTDNGIYSGVYIPNRIITGSSPWGVDPAGIETFVMVVINNYAAAGDARCITQIKFAVTNGGVFSMEKRSTTPGTADVWSEWEFVSIASDSTTNNYLGAKTFDELRDDRYIKSGTYYGLLRDRDNRPFVLEVVTNFDDNQNILETEKNGFKFLRFMGSSRDTLLEEWYAGGFYSLDTSRFAYNSFARVSPQLIRNEFVSLQSRYSHCTMILSDVHSTPIDSFEIPSKGNKIYNHILTKAKSLSVTGLTITVTPNRTTSGTFLISGCSIVDAIYSKKDAIVCYDRFIYLIGYDKSYLVQSITEFEELQ